MMLQKILSKKRKKKKERKKEEGQKRKKGQGKTINLREEGFILAQSLSTQSIMAEKA